MAQSEPGSGNSGRIVVYGASGYTGRLIAHELTERGAEVVLAGRDEGRLERVAADLPGEPEIAAVPLDDTAALRELIGGSSVVVGCAGPFTLHGEPVIAAAAETGTRYLDTTGEQPFIRAAFDRWDGPASANGAALVSGFGFDYVPGDMLAALTAEGLGPLERMTVAYSVSGFGSTRGTALSALEMIRGGDVVWRDGRLETMGRNVDEGRFEFPSPIGPQRVGRYPAGEVITVPRHVDVSEMKAVINLRPLIGAPLGPASAPAMALAGAAMSTPLRAAAGKLISRLPEGPDEDARRAARFTIVCDAEHADGRRRGIARGGDVYGLTAFTIAEGATRMAAAGYDRTGALAPSEAFDPADFMRALEPFGVRAEIEPI